MSRKLVNHHLPPSTTTAKGHITRAWKGLISTRDTNHENDVPTKAEDIASTEQIFTAADDEIFCYSITTDNNKSVISSDLVGRFAIELYAGMNYVLFVVSTNTITL